MAVLLDAFGVAQERGKTIGRVAAASSIVTSALTPVAVLALPVVLLKSAL